MANDAELDFLKEKQHFNFTEGVKIEMFGNLM